MKNIVVNKLVCIVVFIVSFMWIIYSLLLNNVFYSRLKYSKILWYGACGNELFIIKI